MPASRSGSLKNQDTPSTATARANIRRMRELFGLTRDQVIARLDNPRLSSAMLAKLENGDRGVFVDDISELALAFQIPPTVFLIPWEKEPEHTATPADEMQDDGVSADKPWVDEDGMVAFTPRPAPLNRDLPPVLSGADPTLRADAVQDWFLHDQFPDPAKGTVALNSSALEGKLCTEVFTQPANLHRLAEDPGCLGSLLGDATREFIAPFVAEVKRFREQLVDFLHFDPFPLTQGFSPSGIGPAEGQSIGRYPEALITAMDESTPYETSGIDAWNAVLEAYTDVYINYRENYWVKYGRTVKKSTIPAIIGEFDVAASYFKETGVTLACVSTALVEWRSKVEEQ